MSDKKEFQDARGVVTGGSRRMGRAIALEFASKGTNVAIATHHQKFNAKSQGHKEQ